MNKKPQAEKTKKEQTTLERSKRIQKNPKQSTNINNKKKKSEIN